MNEDMINNINKRLDTLESNYKLIKEENKEYEKRIQKNEDLIQNLNKLFMALYKQIKNMFCNLENNLNKKFELLQSKENNEEKNEIVINNKIEHNDNDLFNLNIIYEEMGKMIEKKLEEFEVNLYESLGKKPKKKSVDKKVENKEEKKTSNIDDKNEIIEFKGKNLIEELESKLLKIMSDDKNLTIEMNDINQLKKISAALLIKKKNPLDLVAQFFISNYISDELDRNKKENINKKKGQILIALKDISLKKIEKNQEEEYIKEFRDRYGITEKDLSDKKLKQLIAKYKNEEEQTNILKEILKKLKYLN